VDLVLGPDVYVNASVALGSPPEKVVQRVLGGQVKGSRAIATKWILERVEAMLTAHPHFKKEAIGAQVDTIKKLVRLVDVHEDFAPDDWEKALLAAATAVSTKRIVTDHPDLLAKETSRGVEFVSTEAWLVEQAMPPPPPPQALKQPGG